MKPSLIHVNKVTFQGKTIGEIQEDENGNTWFYALKEPEHYMRKENGFGINAEYLENMKGKIDFLRIRYEGKTKTDYWNVDYSDFMEKANRKVQGEEPQYFISESQLDSLHIEQESGISTSSSSGQTNLGGL